METEEFRRWCRLDGEGEDDNAILFCYGNAGSAKHLLGNKDYSVRGESMLTSYDNSSLVVDMLCDRTGEQHVAIACFYFHFAVRKEQTPLVCWVPY